MTVVRSVWLLALNIINVHYNLYMTYIKEAIFDIQKSNFYSCSNTFTIIGYDTSNMLQSHSMIQLYDKKVSWDNLHTYYKEIA
jgi:hypothetical protein